MNNILQQLLIQVLRNQLTELTTQTEGNRHLEYGLRIKQTQSLLKLIDPKHPIL